ncbi:MAG: hypothetical protein Kow0063_37490 [Anaerolineae bacterium]
MECDDYREKMSLWLDQQLAEGEVRQVEAHIAACPDCRAALDELRRLDRLLSAAPTLSPVPGFTKRFQARLAARRQRRRTWAGLLVLATATLALSLGTAAFLAITTLSLWGNLPINNLLPEVAGLLLDLGRAMAAFLNLAWLIVSAVARGLRHPVFIAYVAATTLLIAAWAQIVTRRIHAYRPARANDLPTS